MEASTLLSPALPTETDKRLTVSLRGLLGIYAIIPLCVAAYLVDRALLGGSLRGALPDDPNKLFLYGLLFGWPHIVASNIILVSNREYRGAFGKRALWASLVIVAFFGIGNFALPYVVLTIVAATATTVHVLKQQIGIGAGAARTSSWLYPAWGWTGIAAGTVLYNTLYLEEGVARFVPFLETTVKLLAALVVVLAIACHTRLRSGLGKAFLWGNTAMVIAPAILHFVGYDFFAIVIPRVIHDTTAFAFYVAHDHNKHRREPANGLYRLASRVPGGIYWMSPAIAVAAAFLLERYADGWLNALAGGGLTDEYAKLISVGFLGYLAMLHYYTESFTWKSGSPYRRHLSMRA